MPEAPETKKAEKTTEKKMVNVIIYPAYPKALAYCEANKIPYADTHKRRDVVTTVIRSKVRTSIPEADYNALRVAQKGCVALTA